MNYILSDFDYHVDFLPLTFTRAVSEIRCGILTSRERWERYLGVSVSVVTEDYLSSLYRPVESGDNIVINPNVLPTEDLVAAVKSLRHSTLTSNGLVIAYHVSGIDVLQRPAATVEYSRPVAALQKITDIFMLNGQFLESDFALLTAGRTSQEISKTNIVIGGERVFLEPGSSVECSTINASAGPVYIGVDSIVMEGSHIRGGFALCGHSELKMGAKIYGPTTIGEHCKVGGEVSNSVFQGFSNKAHDGFIGNAIIGEWCNIGAGGTCSNLKNNYADVKIWDFRRQHFTTTGLQFCGLIMGDHSKCGINTMFNTGTVVGVSANIFGSGFPRTYIPSFYWGGAAGFSEYRADKALAVMERVMKRRQVELTDTYRDIILHIFAETQSERKRLNG